MSEKEIALSRILAHVLDAIMVFEAACAEKSSDKGGVVELDLNVGAELNLLMSVADIAQAEQKRLER